MRWNPEQIQPGKGEPLGKNIGKTTSPRISKLHRPRKKKENIGTPGQPWTVRRQTLGKILQTNSIQRKTKGIKGKDGICVGPKGSFSLKGGNPLKK